MAATLLDRLDARDRALLIRCARATSGRRWWCLFWRVVAHLGGTTMSLAATLVPMVAGGAVEEAAKRAFFALVAGHVLVQMMKRTISRPRPSRHLDFEAFAAEPDRFSFPSGHAAAAMSVAFVYAVLIPSAALPLLLIAMLVGASRVFLAVHYPGVVLVGQLIAVVMGLLGIAI